VIKNLIGKRTHGFKTLPRYFCATRLLLKNLATQLKKFGRSKQRPYVGVLVRARRFMHLQKTYFKLPKFSKAFVTRRARTASDQSKFFERGWENFCSQKFSQIFL